MDVAEEHGMAFCSLPCISVWRQEMGGKQISSDRSIAKKKKDTVEKKTGPET